MENLKDRLKSERIRLGLFQQDLADKLKVSKQTVSHWETGQRTPDALTIKILADFFNVTTDYLLCRTDNPSENYELNKTEELPPELQALLENAKDLPDNVIRSLNNIVDNLKDSFKVVTSASDKDLHFVINSVNNPNGITPDEDKQLHKYIVNEYNEEHKTK